MQHVLEALLDNVGLVALAILALLAVGLLLGMRLSAVRYSDPHRTFEARFGRLPHEQPRRSDVARLD
jgi:uncharacterized protein (DUF924 family)